MSEKINDIQQINTKVIDYLSQIVECKKEVNKLEKENTQLKKQVSNLTQENTILKKEKNDLTDQLNKAKE